MRPCNPRRAPQSRSTAGSDWLVWITAQSDALTTAVGPPLWSTRTFMAMGRFWISKILRHCIHGGVPHFIHCQKGGLGLDSVANYRRDRSRHAQRVVITREQDITTYHRSANIVP